jgi:hypothetical protein
VRLQLLQSRSRGVIAVIVGVGLVAATAISGQLEASAATVPAVVAAHPRIMASASDFARLKSQITSDPATAKLYASVKAEADADLSAPVVTYSESSTSTLLTTSETTLSHAMALGMMFKLTGSQQYLARLWKDMDAVAKFPDWDPNEYLDTAEMTTAVSVAYDWAYSDWNSSQRSELATAIANKGLEPSLAVYQAPATSGGPYKTGGNWSQMSNNWNVVVNSGMAIGALAVSDAEPSVAKPVLADALSSIQHGVGTYANGGGWPEGLGYWEYSTRYLTMLIQALESATGSDQGLLEQPGIAQAGYFPLYMSSSDGSTTFNFADTNAAPYTSSAMEALGTLLHDPVLSGAGAVPNHYGSNVQRLLSIRAGQQTASPNSAGVALDENIPDAGVSTFRSSWTDPDATFLGFRSRNTPTAGHQDLDAGTFSLGALGETWAAELGKDDYALPGYFDSGSGGERWDYYRTRAEGQNTLVIDPSDPSSGYTATQTPTPTFSTNGSSGMAIANLTPAASGAVTSWERGVRTLDGGTDVVVQDEVKATTSFDALWTMHTEASVRLSTDGKTALLYLGGKEMAARITRGDGTFSVAESTPYPTSPDPAQATNTTMNALQIHLDEGAGTSVLAVEFTPVLDSAAPLPAAAPVTRLSNWKLEGTSTTTPTSISVGGASIAGYRKDVHRYRLTVDPSNGVPRVAVTVEAGATASVAQATSVPGTAVAHVSAADGTTSDYYVDLESSTAAAVSPPAEAAYLSSATITACPSRPSLGSQFTIATALEDSSGASTTAQSVRWVTSNPAVVAVNASGTFSAAQPGKATIGAVFERSGHTVTVSKTITVVDPLAVHAMTDADSYAQAGSTAKTNFGTSTMLLVKPHKRAVAATELTRLAFVHFTIPGVKGHKVQSAIVKIGGKVSDGNGTTVAVDAHVVPGSWNEKTLDWANMPALGSKVASATFTSSDGVRKFDITKFVNSSAFTGQVTLAFTEDAPANGQPLLVVMHSKESTVVPAVDVELAG